MVIINFIFFIDIIVDGIVFILGSVIVNNIVFFVVDLNIGFFIFNVVVG